MPHAEKRKLPVGVEDFEKIRREGFYYVDKTTMIRDLLRKWGEVNLFTRPRRFGKSLNMSMLKAFFEIGCDKTLFDGLAISGEQDLCEKYMGKFPVISVSLKGVNGADYETARALLCSVIGNEAARVRVLLETDRVSELEKELYRQLLVTDPNRQGMYAMPDAVLTGCLRVAKESIFTGLNNLKLLSVTNVRFDEYFGFTDEEVRELLRYYGREDRYEAMREWYDGYRFGNVEVYCPWDVISYCDDLTDDPEAEPRDYWSNTSSNDVIRHFIEKVDHGLTRSEIEALVSGEILTKEIHEDLTYNRLYDSVDHIWSVLFATGYLTQRGKAEGKRYRLAIPNREIRNIFTEQIMTMFKEAVAKDGESLDAFCAALQKGDAREAERLFTAYLGKTISIRDTSVRKASKENFYHGILLGILGFKSGWYVRSNEESGESWSDILVRLENEDTGMIIEIKYAEEGRYGAACEQALRQIEEKDYTAKLKEEGCSLILKYAVACFRKKCRIVCEREEYPSEE